MINGHPYVDEQKRAAILAVMEELDYKPNKIAQNLARGKPIILESSYRLSITPSLMEFLNGIMEEAFAQKYKVTLLPTNFDRKLELEYLEEFAAKGFDGLIVITRANHIETFYPYMEKGPIVL